VKRAIGVVVLVAAGAAAWWYVRTRVPHQDLPAGALGGYNVLLVTIDTLRADRVGAYGSTAGLTPALDRLAAEGVRFDAARAHVPLTLPSHTSLMTGRTPPHHGVRDNGAYRLDATPPTLASALKAAGYQTAAFVGAFVLDARFGLGRGFDRYDDQYGERPAFGRVDVVERRAEDVTARGAAWIRQATGPWFAWVHVYDPHEPYAPPPPFDAKFAASPYDGEVAYTDAALGRLFDDLRSASRLDRTLVIVTADHGEGLGDHGERTHGLFAYDSTLRVPLIAWCKDRIRPGIFAEPVGLIDVAPTLLDLLGVAWPGGDGRSLRPRLAGDERGDMSPPLYFEALNANLTRNWAPLTGLVDGRFKLIDLPIPELYDLQADPGEARNLYDERGDDADRLEQLLAKLSSGAPAAPGAALDSATAARLRSLGYVASQPAARPRVFTPADDPKTLVPLDAALDEAMKISGRGDHAAAIAMLEDVIRKRADLPVAYDRLAFVLRAAGRLDEAINALEQSAAKGYADAPVLVSLGTLLQEAGRLDRSAQVLEAALGMNAQDLEARSRLGTTYAKMGRAADAERTFRAVLDVDADSPEALTNLGVLYLSTNRLADGIAILQRAVAADPGLGGAANALAVAYARSGDLPKAVEQWQRILSTQPNNPDLLFNLGTALLQLNRPAEARPLLERFIAIAPPQYAADVARLRQILSRLPK
jgi:arylsulfatase A-like enzyme/Flp pilus assembly protein TadD